jgi:hypothetical protein
MIQDSDGERRLGAEMVRRFAVQTDRLSRRMIDGFLADPKATSNRMRGS